MLILPLAQARTPGSITVPTTYVLRHNSTRRKPMHRLVTLDTYVATTIFLLGGARAKVRLVFSPALSTHKIRYTQNTEYAHNLVSYVLVCTSTYLTLNTRPPHSPDGQLSLDAEPLPHCCCWLCLSRSCKVCFCSCLQLPPPLVDRMVAWSLSLAG